MHPLCVMSTIQVCGGSIMVWGCLSFSEYVQQWPGVSIINLCVCVFLDALDIFRDDNATVHWDRIVKS